MWADFQVSNAEPQNSMGGEPEPIKALGPPTHSVLVSLPGKQAEGQDVYLWQGKMASGDPKTSLPFLPVGTRPQGHLGLGVHLYFPQALLQPGCSTRSSEFRGKGTRSLASAGSCSWIRHS